MGQKINPTGFRLSVNRNWASKWFANTKNFPGMLLEDVKVREYLKKKLSHAAVPAARRHRLRILRGAHHLRHHRRPGPRLQGRGAGQGRAAGGSRSRTREETRRTQTWGEKCCSQLEGNIARSRRAATRASP